MKDFKELFLVTASSALLMGTALPAFAATPESSDTWIQTKLVMAYVLNRHLSTFDIDTDVRDQVVYLKGTVETPIEKNLAEEIAHSITNVKSVKNEIVVDKTQGALARTSPRTSDERTLGQRINDMTTTATIKSKFSMNENIHPFDIDVATKDRVVTLKGTVPSDVERDLVAKITENTDGVEKVNNNLTIGKKS